MAGSLVARKRSLQSRTKVKTGCATCRIRKVKCDENKPFCQKCVNTGRACDGYESPFRFFTNRHINHVQVSGSKSGAALQPIVRSSTDVTIEDVELLNRYFSTKTIFEVKLGCDEEARQVLQASLTDPSIRHAVSCLRALRQNLEIFTDAPAFAIQQTPSYDYGLQQYCMALRGLASSLSSPSSDRLKSALLCCSIFISIEQARGNYATMAQHIMQGLRIMREYRARPLLVTTNKLLPAHPDQLPLLDVFIIKLFAAPCKFSEPPATANGSGTIPSVNIVSPQQQPIKSRNLRAITPDMRTELTRFSTSSLEFLSKVSRVQSEGNALQLLSEKSSLLNALESWLTDFDLVHVKMRSSGPEPIAVFFMRLFHQILKIILMGTLDYSPDHDDDFRTENDRLKCVASSVDERLKTYRMSGKRGGERSFES